MDYKIIKVTKFKQNCILMWCKKTKHTAIIDPGGDKEKIIKKINFLNLKIKKILLTHGHIDHVGQAENLSFYYNVKIFGPHKKDLFLLNILPEQSKFFNFPFCKSLSNIQCLKEKDNIIIGNNILEILHCPGHTPGHIVFFNKPNKLLISGDVIFKKSIGRTDIFQGNYKKLINSIKNKIFFLGDNIVFLPGHGSISTIGDEKKDNPYLR